MELRQRDARLRPQASPVFVIMSIMAAMIDRGGILFDLCMALRKVPPGILRDLGKRRVPIDGLAEKIVAEEIVRKLRVFVDQHYRHQAVFNLIAPTAQSEDGCRAFYLSCCVQKGLPSASHAARQGRGC